MRRIVASAFKYSGTRVAANLGGRFCSVTAVEVTELMSA